MKAIIVAQHLVPLTPFFEPSKAQVDTGTGNSFWKPPFPGADTSLMSNDLESQAFPGGRCLGGSNAINSLTYGRGSWSVYDLWESLGNPGWSWDVVYPFFVQVRLF